MSLLDDIHAIKEFTKETDAPKAFVADMACEQCLMRSRNPAMTLEQSYAHWRNEPHGPIIRFVHWLDKRGGP